MDARKMGCRVLVTHGSEALLILFAAPRGQAIRGPAAGSDPGTAVPLQFLFGL
jgi:hypothetical protein